MVIWTWWMPRFFEMMSISNDYDFFEESSPRCGEKCRCFWGFHWYWCRLRWSFTCTSDLIRWGWKKVIWADQGSVYISMEPVGFPFCQFVYLYIYSVLYIIYILCLYVCVSVTHLLMTSDDYFSLYLAVKGMAHFYDSPMGCWRAYFFLRFGFRYPDFQLSCGTSSFFSEPFCEWPSGGDCRVLWQRCMLFQEGVWPATDVTL